VKKILNKGHLRETRNSKTLSLFSEKLDFNLQEGFPLLTCRKLPLRVIVEEMLFFLKGGTNTKILENKQVNIWKANTSREFLQSRNLSHYKEGEMGPMYGFQLRHYGAKFDYSGKTSYKNMGIDQWTNIIELLKNDPYSRRMVINLWNPTVFNECVLPPCHFCIQFYVREVYYYKYLDAQLNIRSSDVMLGLPFNIAQYAFMIHLLCNITNIGLQPGKLRVIIGDCHIYESHIFTAKELLQRPIQKILPQLFIKNRHEHVEQYEWSDISLINYKPQPPLKFAMIP
jgi:thymidylate synthase